MIDDDKISDRLRWSKQGNWDMDGWQCNILYRRTPGLQTLAWTTLALDRKLEDDISSQAIPVGEMQ
jgi:hypothetical protein